MKKLLVFLLIVGCTKQKTCTVTNWGITVQEVRIDSTYVQREYLVRNLECYD